MISFPEINFNVYNSLMESLMEIQVVGKLGTVYSLITSPLYTVLLPVFQNKIKAQVNLGRTRFCFCVNPCNILVIRILPK